MPTPAHTVLRWLLNLAIVSAGGGPMSGHAHDRPGADGPCSCPGCLPRRVEVRSEEHEDEGDGADEEDDR